MCAVHAVLRENNGSIRQANPEFNIRRSSWCSGRYYKLLTLSDCLKQVRKENMN